MELQRTASDCSGYYARRVPHWIGISNRICASSACSSLVGHSLAGELMYSARREIDLRAEYTRQVISETVARNPDVPAPLMLVDCTRLAGELVRDCSRDVVTDIERASRFLPGVDPGCVAAAMSSAVGRISQHLLLVVGRRPDFER